MDRAMQIQTYEANNDDYVNGAGFCCESGGMSAKSIPTTGDAYEKLQYYYHPDHLGSASYDGTPDPKRTGGESSSGVIAIALVATLIHEYKKIRHGEIINTEPSGNPRFENVNLPSSPNNDSSTEDITDKIQDDLSFPSDNIHVRKNMPNASMIDDKQPILKQGI
ncbi:MAG: hypothetical protein ACK5IJ_06060 [Mangrovibacterium sp.]